MDFYAYMRLRDYLDGFFPFTEEDSYQATCPWPLDTDKVKQMSLAQIKSRDTKSIQIGGTI